MAWCNGNTTDFDSVILGSNPSAITNTFKQIFMTSIEWLLTWMTKNQYFIGNDLLNAFEEAEEMHKQEIINAVNLPKSERWFDSSKYNSAGEQYYNQTFKKD